MVITTLAVAFLALSHRETAAVTSALATTDAGHAADVGLERSLAQIIAQLTARNKVAFGSDVMGPDLIVSVAHDVPNNIPSFLMNVGTNRWARLTTIDRLFADPAVPVLVWTNKSYNTPAAVEARDYVDLNRNFVLDATGNLTDVDDSGVVIRDANGAPVVQWRVGDPQWIGILRDPTRPHSSSNHFIARYAFILLPTGRSLDVNWIHNQAIPRSPANDWSVDGYFRHQNVGTYELNFAAFLADLNTNYWNNLFTGIPYAYSATDSTVAGAGSVGDAFSSAREFLQYRYGGSKARPASANLLFAKLGPLNANYFPLDFIDGYANGPLAPFGSSARTALLSDANDDPAIPWPGADSPQHFFTIHDFWDATKLPGPALPQMGFRARLIAASARVNTEDRYTYYRMLQMFGTDSPAESDGRLNINYVNFDVTNTASLKGYATNFVPWTAAEFFHAAADRMLTNEFFPYGLTNIGLLEGRSIPIYARTNPGAGNLSVFGFPITNSGAATVFTNSTYPLYSPRIHQLLQLAVNIYEATQTNDNAYLWPTPPTVMRPTFERRNNEIYIVGYVSDNGTDFQSRLQGGTLRWYELGSSPASFGNNDNLYDIPILFGARKGFPNFNEFTTHTLADFMRKIEVRKDANYVKISTNQTFVLSATSYTVAELFNSYGGYTNFYGGYPGAQYTYPRELQMIFGNESTSVFTNDATGPARVNLTTNSIRGDAKTFAAGTWTNGFRLTQVMTNVILLPSTLYVNAPTNGLVTFNNAALSEVITGPFTNRWGLTISNRVRCFLFDGGRLVDCYTSARMNSAFDISAELEGRPGGSLLERQWSRRANGNVTDGVFNQIQVSLGAGGTADSTLWTDYGDLNGYSSVAAAINGFKAFLSSNSPNVYVAQAGFSPHTRLLQVSTWQANDPLVHGMVYDLYRPDRKFTSVWRPKKTPAYSFYEQSTFGDSLHPGENAVRSTPGGTNELYNPWGGRDGNSMLNADYAWPEKDPGVYSSDFWDFPTQKLPNLGWLGRIHRGTPWQTVFLKADDPAYSGTVRSGLIDNAWWQHAGGSFMPQTFPTNDWRLLDLFTAAIHPNATRGRLSINQTNVAAWSAVFSGLRGSVLVNTDPFWNPVETNLSPASVDIPALGANAPLLRLVEGINRTRGNRTFRHLSDFMAVPELTINSPFLPGDDGSVRRSRDYFATDADWEKIPQQILSLVKVGEPRYVIYAWGQSLKPADYTPGIGMSIDPGTLVPRNYQITGEMATRAVVRVEFGKDADGRTRYDRPHTVVENFNILPNE